MSAPETPARVEYAAQPDRSVALCLDGTPEPPNIMHRVAVRPCGTIKAATAVAALLNRALREGAAYGPRNQHAELAASLSREPDPAGLVHYDLTPGFVLTRTADGHASTVGLPAVKSRTVMVEICNQAGRAFDIGGRHPHAVPPAPAGEQDHDAAVAAQLAELPAGGALVEIALNAGRGVHYAVEDAAGAGVCSCGKAGRTRFALARVHMGAGRVMPGVRELGRAPA